MEGIWRGIYGRVVVVCEVGKEYLYLNQTDGEWWGFTVVGYYSTVPIYRTSTIRPAVTLKK